MPAFIAALLGGIVTIAGSVVGRVLIALGISYVTYAGISTGLSALKTQAVSALSTISASMAPGLVGLLGVLKVDVAVSILFSALAARLVLKGLTGGAIKRAVQT